MGAWRRHTRAHGRQLSLLIGRHGGSYIWTVTGPGAEGAGEERLSGLGFPLTLWVEVYRGKLLKERKHGSFPAGADEGACFSPGDRRRESVPVSEWSRRTASPGPCGSGDNRVSAPERSPRQYVSCRVESD